MFFTRKQQFEILIFTFTFTSKRQEFLPPKRCVVLNANSDWNILKIKCYILAPTGTLYSVQSFNEVLEISKQNVIAYNSLGQG